jgi:hypothetical protein
MVEYLHNGDVAEFFPGDLEREEQKMGPGEGFLTYKGGAVYSYNLKQLRLRWGDKTLADRYEEELAALYEPPSDTDSESTSPPQHTQTPPSSSPSTFPPFLPYIHRIKILLPLPLPFLKCNLFGPESLRLRPVFTPQHAGRVSLRDLRNTSQLSGAGGAGVEVRRRVRGAPPLHQS